MTDSTKLIERLRTFGLASIDDRREAAALIEQQAAALEAANARIAELEAAAKAEPIYQTCFIQGQWRDIDRFEYDRAKGLRDDLARIVYTAPTAALAQPLEAQADARWQPIETAPKDGTEVLIYLGAPWSKTEKARWYAPWNNWQAGVIPSDPVREEYFGIGASVPTHWQPLPAAPAALSQKAGEQE